MKSSNSAAVSSSLSAILDAARTLELFSGSRPESQTYCPVLARSFLTRFHFCVDCSIDLFESVIILLTRKTAAEARTEKRLESTLI